jgi:methionyl-tRNA formyltransferase
VAEKMNFDWEEKSIEKLEYEAGFVGGKIFFDNYKGLTFVNLTNQDHTKATFTKILKKEDGDVSKEIQDKNLEIIWRKYNAYKNWPGIYFYKTPPNPLFKKEGELSPIRIKITQISKDKNTGEIKIEKLLPESKKEISLADFENSYGKIL